MTELSREEPPLSTMTTTERKRGAPMQRHVAYESLRRALQLGRMRAGERLREEEWSKRLGVNRAALREAMAQLLPGGLLVEGPKGGFFVPPLAVEDFQEIIELRLMFESAAVDHILRAQRNGPVGLHDLETVCNDQEWLLQKGYTADLAEADQLFHETLVALGGGRRLLFLYRTLPQPAVSLASMDRIRGPRLWEEMVAQHRAILDALSRGRCDRVKASLQEHYSGQHSLALAPAGT